MDISLNAEIAKDCSRQQPFKYEHFNRQNNFLISKENHF